MLLFWLCSTNSQANASFLARGWRNQWQTRHSRGVVLPTLELVHVSPVLQGPLHGDLSGVTVVHALAFVTFSVCR